MTTALHIQQVGRALRPQAWHDQHNDPCDPWPVFMWNGEACRMVDRWVDELPRYETWAECVLFGERAVPPHIVQWRWFAERDAYHIVEAVPL